MPARHLQTKIATFSEVTMFRICMMKMRRLVANGLGHLMKRWGVGGS